MPLTPADALASRTVFCRNLEVVRRAFIPTPQVRCLILTPSMSRRSLSFVELTTGGQRSPPAECGPCLTTVEVGPQLVSSL